ncbi:hypothetical protein CHS0354_025948 [Potamilus streckersoni]|uniref:5'-nucleotidase n=1 Tax=Potamilus streckersoni TaxID=2493646 RepID=A0AAE0T3X0_9BIVA|nr:hypothetical protein CHS0354_025948 [Potamilus streckersoni]
MDILKICLFFFVSFIGLLSVSCFNLTILHTNDFHAHFEQINKYSSDCTEEQAQKGECFGGIAREATKIKEIRDTHQNVILLDAGDRFTGTLWFFKYRGFASAYFMKKLQYDAMCIGNHEFDLQVPGLVNFLKNITIPVVSANIDVSGEPRLQGLFNKSIILNVNGTKIGIVGYITEETSSISDAGPTVKFVDQISIVQTEVQNLQAAGITIIIGLSHAGYGIDQKVAREVDGLDVIVGGHTHSFLYSGPQPSNEEIEGPYPTIVNTNNGRKVLVVTAYAWSKYLGYLNVLFDDKGEVSSWNGNPILLDKTVPQDNETLAEVKELQKPLEAQKREVVGHTAVLLEGETYWCRIRECNLGNLYTDAMISYHLDYLKANDTWAAASIALVQSGGIRASIEPGNITMGNVLTVFPFGNNIDLIKIRGIHLRQMLEHAVENYDPINRPGSFLQMSGIHVTYDLGSPKGQRVVSVEVRCHACKAPTYSLLDDNTVYNVLLPNFVINGGDGFTIIKETMIQHIPLNSLDIDLISKYLSLSKSVFPSNEGRIKFVTRKQTSDANQVQLSVLICQILLFMYYYLATTLNFVL